MSSYNSNQESFEGEDVGSDEGQHTMAVLSTLGGGGGEAVLAEGAPMGLDHEAGQAKLSGSTLAVGVVVVLGAATLFGMKMTLGSIVAGAGPAEAIAEIDSFIATHTAAQQTGNEGPIKAPDGESEQVLAELRQDPNANQIPPEDVKGNPFDISQIVQARTPKGPDGTAASTIDHRAEAVKRAQAEAGKLKIDGISGPIVFIDGKDYRVGDTIAGGKFTLTSIDGLACIVRTTDEYRISLRLRYR